LSIDNGGEFGKDQAADSEQILCPATYAELAMVGFSQSCLKLSGGSLRLRIISLMLSLSAGDFRLCFDLDGSGE